MMRTFTIVNVYEDGTVVGTTAQIDLPAIGSDEAVDDYIERNYDDLFTITGTGKTDGDAYYEIESSDGLDPHLQVEFG